MSRVTKHLPGLARRSQLPRIPGTSTLDLAPLAAGPAARLEPEPRLRPMRPEDRRRTLEPKNVNTGRTSFESAAVEARLEARAYKVQKPMQERHNQVVEAMFKERRQWVDNDLGKPVIVCVGGVRFLVDAGKSQQSHSIAIAYEEYKNALIKSQYIMREGIDGSKAGRPDTEDMRDALQYYADMDASI